MPWLDNEKGSDAHASAGGHAEEDEDKGEDEEVEKTSVLRVRVSSIHSMRSVRSGTCGGARR